MADDRAVYTPLEDASGVGQPNLARTDGGQLASLGNHAGVLAFKDSSGNDVKPQLNASGQLPVSFDAAGTSVRARGTAASGTNVDVATLTLTASTNYNCIEYMGSCTKDTLFEVIQNDNGTETILDRFIVGAGQFTYQGQVDAGKGAITSGATGAQELIVRASAISGNSDFHARVSAQQL